MFYNYSMDAIQRLKLLSAQMHLEPAEDNRCLPAAKNPRVTTKRDALYISQGVLPNGKRIQLLKTLLTSVCERNCYYCPFRAGRDLRRATFKPQELAYTFMALYKAGIAEGIFLSSGMANGGVNTQEKMLDTAEILRKRLAYQGYLHLKIMPGVEYGQVERAMQLADRVSINLEAPNSERLLKLAPHKEFIQELLEPLRWINQIRRNSPGRLAWKGYWPSSVSQFVVGGAGESDAELIHTSEFLFKKLGVKRTYYSAFTPIPETPLENLPATTPQRELRLYQASFLLRDYHFSLEDLPFDPDGNLPLKQDPKAAWAQAHLVERPVDINLAEPEQLLRVPGIGPKSTQAILAARQQGQRIRLHDLTDLHRLGVNTKRAAPFILVDGKRPAHQLSLWATVD
jgi:predicted DNA-binding helix-hairpin-helix protein